MSGKRERPAHYDDEQLQNDSPQKISGRKIYKIKRPTQQDQDHGHSQPHFTLFENVDKIHQKDHGKQQLSIEQKQNQKQFKQKQEIKQNKQSKYQQKQLQSIQQQFKPQLNKQQQKQASSNKQQQKKNITSPFLFSLSGETQFGNGIGIFSNQGNKSQSIFGNFFNKSQSATKQLGGNIFLNNNIFNKTEKTPEQKLPQNPSKSIFSFSTNGIPPIKKQPSELPQQKEDDQQADSVQLQKNQKQEIDPLKSTGTYQYNTQYTILFQQKLLKIKKDHGELVQNVQITLREDKKQEKQKNIIWLIVRLIATKHQIVSGAIVKNKSQVKKIGDKDQNIMVSVVEIYNNKANKCVLKLQFENGEKGKQFLEIVENIIKQQ